MRLLVGLGNPGSKYEYNRHNVGFMVVDWLAIKIQNSKPRLPDGQARLPDGQVKTQNQELKFRYDKKLQSLVLTTLHPISYNLQLILAKPTTFMNSSGIAVKKLITHYKVKISDLWVIHDDLDLRLGEYKIQFGVGPKLHYGVSSIEETLGTKNFWRVRVGVDNRNPDNRTPGEEYVLQNFENREIAIIRTVINDVAQALIKKVAGSK